MSSESWTILKLLQWTSEYFSSFGIESSRLDAELLLAKSLGLTRVQLYTQFDRPLNEKELKDYKTLIQRRGKREPISYLLGTKEFYSRDFKVTPDVLIPRPETELLIEESLEFAKDRIDPLQIIDIGTGTGCIAITLAMEIPNAQIWGVDVSQKALEIARENIEKYSLQERVKLLEWDILKDDWTESPQQFDLIVSNPPYIRSEKIKTLAPEIQFEPLSALDGGKDGLDYYRRLIDWSSSHLAKEGIALFEIGSDQEKELLELVKKSPFQTGEIKFDLAGKPRVVKILNSGQLSAFSIQLKTKG